MFTHLANLFFEQSKIIDEDEEQAISVAFSLEKNVDNMLIGQAFLTWDGQEYSATFTELEENDDEKIQTRQLKRIY